MKMDESTLVSQIEQLERQASSYYGGEVAKEQSLAMDYYLREPFGDEEEGRSQVISSDVWDVVEGLMPIILKPFVSSDDVVRFNPEGEEDVEAAEQESDYMNYIITQKNDVFSTLVAWVKTGLLQKNGVVKYWWDKSRKTELERYEGLTDDQYTLLLQDENVTVVKHAEEVMNVGMDVDTQQPIVEKYHDVELRITKEVGEAKYCVIPPEEFLINSDASNPNPQEAQFVEHRTRKTLSDIRAMGYDIDDDVSDTSNSEDPQYSEQYTARRQGESYDTDNKLDPASREVVFREVYIKIDYDNDGIAELRKVCLVGSQVLCNEETEEIPFCSWTPYPQPFKFYGRCPADETLEIQLTKSVLLRQNMNNIYTINNNRVFASNKVNMDDLLDNQIAGIVRVDGDVVGNHVVSVPITPIGGVIQPMIEYFDSAKENRTGFTRYNQGTDSNSLNKTATGIRIIAEAGNERVGLISRAFAEMGLKNLMIGMHGLCRRHATKAETVRLRGKWVTINPREWRTRYDMTVSVGLGNADQQMKMQAAQLMLDKQMMLLPAGVVKPENIYNAAKKLAEAVGEKNPDKYFSSPMQQQDGAQEQDPTVMQQMEQLGGALEDAMKQIEVLRSDKEIKARELEIKAFDADTKRVQAMQKTNTEEIDKTAIAVAEINAKSAEKIALINASKQANADDSSSFVQNLETGEIEEKPNQTQLLLSALIESNQELLRVMAESLRPNTADIVIKKQADGSFIGTKVEA